LPPAALNLEQLDARNEKVIGGMDARIEIVPAIGQRGPAKPAATRTTRDKPPPKVRAKRRS
jgi:hypothetical protein